MAERKPESRAAKEVFLDALELDGAEREQFLERACAGDDALRARVDALFVAHEEAEAKLGRRIGALPTVLVDLRPGDRVGPYRLIERLGEGGFGVVFRAAQQEPLKREVALKVVKLGMDTRAVVARFELERQALARMEHPSIARVFDAGATEAGRPYFAMELVDGLPITDFCRARRLGPRERVELFRAVCLAVQHAHHKGVIHRDLKPSNVLVTEVDGRAQPKVIDFGIAKATERRLDEALRTSAQGLVGTPAYMSPEQAAGADVDSRTDVYSLGVLLYELIAGAPPFDLRGLGLVEVQRAILEREPLRPSTQRRRAERSGDGVLEPALRDVPAELDWIVLRCLEKDPARRYSTAASLAADLQRFLEERPIEAAPPSALYRVRKLARRHRVASVAALAVLASLVAAVAGTGFGLVRARRANERLGEALGRAREAEAHAAEEARVTREINGFLNRDLLAAAAPSAELGRGVDVPLREVLDAASERIEEAAAPGGRFADAPRIEAAIRETLGDTYAALGEHALAVPHFERALELLRRESDGEAVGGWRVASALGRSLHWVGRTDEALPLLERTLEAQRRSLPPDDPDATETLARVATIYQAQGRVDEAGTAFEEALGRVTESRGASDPLRARLLGGLGFARVQQERIEEARPLLEEALALAIAAHGERHPDVLDARIALATLELYEHRDERAEAQLRAALDASRALQGDDHPATLAVLGNLAEALRRQERHDEALPFLREAAAGYARRFGPDHQLTQMARSAHAALSADAGAWEEAGEVLRELAEASEAQSGPDHPETLALRRRYARTLHERGEHATAEALLIELVELADGAQRPSSPILAELARCVRCQGREVEAGALVAEAQARSLEESLSALELAGERALQGELLFALDDAAGAESAWREAFDASADADDEELGELHARVAAQLAELCAGQGRDAEAARYRGGIDGGR